MIDNVVIFYNPLKADAKDKAFKLCQSLGDSQVKAKVQATEKNDNDWEAVDKETKIAVVMGGDGTFLLAARQILRHNIPLLGINYGHLGFLSEYGDITMEDLKEKILAEEFFIDERSTLEAYIPSLEKKIFALNDIAINRYPHSNLLNANLYIDNDLLHSFRSDGIVVSTPTGSTAYALSAGGAVMDPHIKAFQIVPIAAHSLNSRPQVICEEQEIEFENKDEKTFYIQADGQEIIELQAKSKIIINKAEYNLKIAKLNDRKRSFYSTLRDKMRWGEIA